MRPDSESAKGKSDASSEAGCRRIQRNQASTTHIYCKKNIYTYVSMFDTYVDVHIYKYKYIYIYIYVCVCHVLVHLCSVHGPGSSTGPWHFGFKHR